MALKKWKEMNKVDVTPFVKQLKDDKGNEFDYLSWSTTTRLLYENGAEDVNSGVYADEKTGHVLHMTEQGFTDKNGAVNHCPFVHVWVEIDGKRRDLWYPVISGSFVVKDMQLNQMRINNAIIRAQNKCIAINWGLGFSLWEKDDESVSSGVDVIELQSAENLFKKLGTMVSRLMEKGMTEAEIADKLGLDTDRIGDIMRVELARVRDYEKKLNKMLKEVDTK